MQVVALVIIGISGWLISEIDDFSFVSGNRIITGGAVVIAAGIITIIFSALGIISAIFKLRSILVIVSTLKN